MGYGNLQQPAPIPNGGPVCWDLVLADVEHGAVYDDTPDDRYMRLRSVVLSDMRERHAFGMAKYPCALQPANGRDALADWYQEALDGAVYARQVVEEYGARPARIPSAADDHARVTQAYQRQLALVFTIRDMLADRDAARDAAKGG